jgi:hypothetical protein
MGMPSCSSEIANIRTAALSTAGRNPGTVIRPSTRDVDAPVSLAASSRVGSLPRSDGVIAICAIGVETAAPITPWYAKEIAGLVYTSKSGEQVRMADTYDVTAVSTRSDSAT